MITLKEYVGPYEDSVDWTPECQDAAQGLLDKVNTILNEYVADGGYLPINPTTQSLVSGSGNGGFRTQLCPIGAPKSKHKTGHGMDVYCPMPDRALSKWCYAHSGRMEALGLSMEDARWTPGWCHFQDIPPGPPGSPWRLDFVPDSTPAKCAPLPEQVKG